MSHLSYSFYILNTLFITLLEWGSNELITCLPITNPGSAGSKPIGDFMVRSIKWVPETPRDLVGNIKLSPWNDCTRLKQFNSIFLSCQKVPFLRRVAIQYSHKFWKISIFCLLFVTPIFLEVTRKASWKESS